MTKDYLTQEMKMVLEEQMKREEVAYLRLNT
jgi:hypothetical protein